MGIFDEKKPSGPLVGKRIAMLATEGFEEVELTKPKAALEDAGAVVDVIAPETGIKSGEIRAWDMTDWGKRVEVTVELAEADAGSYDGLVLPGGAMNPDKLRLNADAVAFVKRFFEAGKPVGAICHAPWTLIEADVVRGRTLTSWPSLRTDLKNAGANWTDREVVEDGNLITSRKPDDIPAFNAKLIEVFGRAGGASEGKAESGASEADRSLGGVSHAEDAPQAATATK